MSLLLPLYLSTFNFCQLNSDLDSDVFITGMTRLSKGALNGMELALERNLCSSLFIIFVFVFDLHFHIHIAEWMGWGFSEYGMDGMDME